MILFFDKPPEFGYEHTTIVVITHLHSIKKAPVGLFLSDTDLTAYICSLQLNYLQSFSWPPLH